jgi:hypothetical protein
MVEAGTLCVNADAIKKAGLNASATVVAEGYTNIYIKMAEGFVCANAKYDYVTNYASVSTIGKEALRDITSSMAGIYMILYDMSGFTSRTEAQTMLDINWTIVREGLTLLRDDKYHAFVLRGTTG